VGLRVKGTDGSAISTPIPISSPVKAFRTIACLVEAHELVDRGIADLPYAAASVTVHVASTSVRQARPSR
jgi:hypothetical protein